MTMQESIRLLDPDTIKKYIKDEMQIFYEDETFSAAEAIAAACEVACEVMKERLENDMPGKKVDFCAGCVNEYDLSCYCHGGRGYVPRIQPDKPD